MLVLKTNTTLLYKDLFEWWNEETEYIFRRIRKSAALARGYNRLSLERLSEERLSMQAERERRKNGRNGNVVLRFNFKKVPKRRTI
ncbi:myb-like protein X [Vespula squamosa]|uniref:Myb-like protein X n=1 Tax=Vespula squamosa TaxID=30214 RepID=A0ABD1ZXV7_VESSQ